MGNVLESSCSNSCAWWNQLPISRSKCASGSPRQGTSILEEPVLRPRQAKMLAQSRALVVTPKQSASLQLGDDALDEIVEAARQIRKHHGEAVRSFRVQPFFHLIGD